MWTQQLHCKRKTISKWYLWNVSFILYIHWCFLKIFLLNLNITKLSIFDRIIIILLLLFIIYVFDNMIIWISNISIIIFHLRLFVDLNVIVIDVNFLVALIFIIASSSLVDVIVIVTLKRIILIWTKVFVIITYLEMVLVLFVLNLSINHLGKFIIVYLLIHGCP